MKTTLTIVLLLVLTQFSKGQIPRHELGINFAKSIDYKNSVWDESGSFLQVLSPITYKYFITEEKALRATLHYNSNEDSLTYDYSGYIKDASCFTLGIGYQKFYRSGKLKPTLYSDLSYVSEDFYEVDLNGLFTYSSDYTAVGFRISGGAGLRYEFNPKWALAYEADLRLQIRRMDGFITLRGHKTSWSNAIITNLKFDPISNFSVNFRL